MQDNRNPLSEKNVKGTSTWIGIGIIVGTVVGVLIDNVGLGIALGLVFGAGVRVAFVRRRQ